MTIEKEGQDLINKHQELYDRLFKIPEEREMIFRKKVKGKLKIGNPRFKEKEYEWPANLLKQLRNHLKDLWNYFERYSYWLDSSILILLDFRSRKTSKKSIMFLLEKDLWETDEVCGDYLIEKNIQKNMTIISYVRFNQSYHKFPLDTIDDKKIKDWIVEDAIKQIKEQFTFLWDKLEKEIKIVMTEKFKKKAQNICI